GESGYLDDDAKARLRGVAVGVLQRDAAREPLTLALGAFEEPELERERGAAVLAAPQFDHRDVVYRLVLARQFLAVAGHVTTAERADVVLRRPDGPRSPLPDCDVRSRLMIPPPAVRPLGPLLGVGVREEPARGLVPLEALGEVAPKGLLGE